MPPKLTCTIRTADRSPKPNYLGQTVRSLLTQGVDPSALHLFPTDPDVGWLDRELDGLPALAVHAPEARCTPNANGVRQVSVLDVAPADWLVMTEDDVEWCQDPMGSIARWLEDHGTPQRVMYRFFAFDELVRQCGGAWLTPCREQKGSQAVALRAADARRFVVWAEAHPKNWRPNDAPFQKRPHDGFDKMLGYWALSEDRYATGLVSRPFFVRHLGVQSAIHSHGIRRESHFAGAAWRYQGHGMEMRCPS